MPNLKKKWLVVWKMTWGIWKIFTRALENLKNLYFSVLLLTKVHNVWGKKKYRWVMFDGIEDWCWILKEEWPVLSKMTWRIWQIFVHRLKNSNFILESEMAEINQIDQIDQMHYKKSILLGNKWIAHLIKIFTYVPHVTC